MVEEGVGDLKNAKAYILPGVTREFTDEEIVDFVKEGGKLLILVHISPNNLKPILSKFGIDVSSRPYEFMEVKAIPGVECEVTSGIKEIYMKGVFPVNGDLFIVKETLFLVTSRVLQSL